MSALVKVVTKLKDHQWVKILDAAAVQARHHKVNTSNILITIEDSSDFELEDSDEKPDSDGEDPKGGNDGLLDCPQVSPGQPSPNFAGPDPGP